MILHKYFDKYGLDTLVNLEMKAGIPSGFNDPFEFLPRNINKWNNAQSKRKLKDKKFTEEVYQVLKKTGHFKNKKEFKSKLKTDKELFCELLTNQFGEEKIWGMIKRSREYADKITRITSFSSEETTKLDQILMWAHYTEKHQYLRFHFDSEKLIGKGDTIEKMNYSSVRPEINLTLELKSPAFLNQLKISMITKSIAWKYENEYRLFVFPNNCTTRNINNQKMYFYKFDPKALLRIDFGINCSESTRKNVLEEIEKPEKSHIKVYDAILNHKEYTFDYTSIN